MKVDVKQIAAASRIQRFWRDGKNRLEVEKDSGRVEKQTKAKLCNCRVGGDVHAASSGVAYLLVYTYL